VAEILPVSTLMATTPVLLEETLLAAVRYARIGVGLLDASDRWLDANQWLCDLLGYSRDELVTLHRTATTSPDDISTENERLLRLRAGETAVVHLEERYRHKSGKVVWVHASLASTDRTDGPRTLLVIVSDLVARRELLRGLSIQHLVSRIIARAQPPAETIAAVLEEVARALSWSYAAFWEVDTSGETLSATSTWKRPDREFTDFDVRTKQISMKKGEGVPGLVWNSAQPFWDTDVGLSQRYPRAHAASGDGLHSVFAFPVRTAEKIFAVMELFAEDVLPPDDALLSAAEGVGYQLGEFLERSRARAAEHESEIRKASILDTALDSIVTSDHRGVVTEFNPAAERMFGYRKEEVIGRQMVDLIIPPAYRQAHLNGMARYLATGEARVLGRRIEIEAMRKDGSIFPVELAIVRVPLPGSAFFTAYLRDLTERRKLETEQARLLQESEAANQAKSEFLATMSHELRTPLNAIAGYADLLRMGVRGPVTDAQVADLDRITRSQAHLLGLINDILQFAKLEAGQVEITVEKTPLKAVVVSAAELVKPQAESKNIAIIFDRCDESLVVCADRDRFLQILLNLLSNAVKFTLDGGSITISCDADGETARISICDTGVGIPTDQQERIFDPFVQVHGGTTRPSDGVGLGLAISRDIARQMKGEISVTSSPGVGSTFTVTLPRVVD
jgi:PAS domain S-box-containing protein